MSRRILFINRHAPHGTHYAPEQLQMAMVFGAFEQQVSMLFMDAGVYALRCEQKPGVIGFRDFSKTYASLDKYYDIKGMYVEKESLQQRGLVLENLVVQVEVLDAGQVLDLLSQQDFIL